MPGRVKRSLLTASLCYLIAAGLLAVVSNGAAAAEGSNQRSRVSPRLLEAAPDELRRQFVQRINLPVRAARVGAGSTPSDWRAIIDATWGPGLPVHIQASRWSRFWNTIDDGFASFHNIDVNWDSIGTVCSAEIVDSGVSRGRFAAMMNHATRALKEGHTMSRDSVVFFTQPAPGIPLMFVGGWGVNDHFGAGLTPLPDSSLLVYDVVDNHPLGLAPGDIVLGYDGIPWRERYPQLLAAELPITGHSWGSSESSYAHAWLMAAGLNWHLFDTIDIVKYASSDTLRLPTSQLEGHSMTLFATEQMDIPGVPKPDLGTGELVSFGTIEDGRIGYIYSLGWFVQEAKWQWTTAVYVLAEASDVVGIIVDLRNCYGGNPDWARQGLEPFFDCPVDEIGIAVRSDPDDHYDMQPSTVLPDDWLKIDGDTIGYCDKPVAVLIGPGCASLGDVVALLLTFRPNTRLFGKATAACFNGPDVYTSGPDFYFRYACNEMYLRNNPGHYLTHLEFPNPQDFPWVSYEDVWLTAKGVAQGRDDVVEAAVNWILGAVDVPEHDDEDYLPDDFILWQNYPNPFNAATTITYHLRRRAHVRLDVYNVLGARVTSLVDEVEPAGSYTVPWAGTDQQGRPVASGVYIYKLRAAGVSTARKMLLLK